MSKSNENNAQVLRIPLGVVSADTLFKAMQLLNSKKAIVKSFKVLDPTGVAAHASNTVKIQLKKGSTLLAEWDTTATTGDGALVANTWAQAPETNIEVDGGDVDVNVDISASGALTAGSVAQIEWYYV